MASAPQLTDPKALLKYAKELYKERRFQDSRVAFNKVISQSNEAADGAEGFFGLGVIDLNEGDLAAAAINFQKCLRLDPLDANSYYYLGEISGRQNHIGEAEVFYRKAVEVNPTHLAAQEKLASLQPQANPAAAVNPPIERRAGTPAVAQGAGIYDYIRNDPSALAKQTLQLIDSLALSSTQRLSAFAAPIIARALAAFFVLYVLITLDNWFSFLHSRNNASMDGPARMILVAVCAYLVISLVVCALKAKTTRYTFDKGRLRIDSGILKRTYKNKELYRVEDVSLSQTFANRLTGDGTILLRLSSGHGSDEYIPLTGLAKIDELRTLFDKLRELVLLLRTGAWGKGVIY
jgi:tetratricopeptide (TPR) repeat protein